jgi:predicted transcriptional regulator
MKPQKETSITFRVTEELKKKLEAMAEKESRSLSNMIQFILEKATKERK